MELVAPDNLFNQALSSALFVTVILLGNRIFYSELEKEKQV